jgi:hypothetical protein
VAPDDLCRHRIPQPIPEWTSAAKVCKLKRTFVVFKVGFAAFI